MAHGNQRHGKGYDEEPVSWQELKEFVLDQVKRAGQKIDVEYVKEIIRERGGNVDKVLDKIAKKGYLGRTGAPVHPRFPIPHSPANTRPRAAEVEPSHRRSSALFREYRKKTHKRVKRVLTGFRVHAAGYIGVNTFLLITWALTGGGFPWFLIPAGAWGIGLLNHLTVVVQRLRQRREIDMLPQLADRETLYLKSMQNKRLGFASHFTSSAGLTAFLLMVNVITGGGFPWFLFPTGALGIGVFMHWAAYAPRVRAMKRDIRKWIGGGARSGGPVEGTAHVEEIGEMERHEVEPQIIHEAGALRRSILKQIDEMEKDHPSIGKDMRPLLDTYYEQVNQLAYKSRELDTILGELPGVDLIQDRTRLLNRMQKTESDRLKKEYEKSILEVDRQLASIKELSHGREMLGLRISSAVNLMKQLQLDLVRVKGVSLTNTASFDLLKEKSNELSTYLDDLEAGYTELEEDST